MLVGRRPFLRQVGAALLATACGPTTFRSRAHALPPPARAERVFADAVARAQRRVRQAPIRPAPEVPPELRGISYDDYRQIRFRTDESLWRHAPGQFEAQLFHRGFYYGRDVAVHVHDEEGLRRLDFDPALFEYPDVLDPTRFSGLGFAGVRLHAPINTAEYKDEVLVFLGASYFRSLGRGQAYGLSGRCLSIDSGLGRPEEFPEITSLHLVTPRPEDESLHLVADVRGPSVEAAFHFTLSFPGGLASERSPRRSDDGTTRLEVDAAVHLRRPVEALGLAPLTSMFLFGEDSPGRFGDYRPEVHDSDGLVLHAANGERIFRPLRNPPRTTLSSFRLEQPRGFGLVQRDRAFESYQDTESHYQRRPSALITTHTGFGAGAVRLLEIATRLETDDNIGTFFVPDGDARALRYGYRVDFGDEARRDRGARVVATRLGRPEATVHPDDFGASDGLFVIDWAGADLEGIDALDARVDAAGGEVSQIRTERIGARWRLVFRVRAEAPDVELRAFLHRGGDALGETLAYLWQPEQSA